MSGASGVSTAVRLPGTKVTPSGTASVTDSPVRTAELWLDTTMV